MGQKVNPHGMRVGVIKDWDSRWYAKDEKVGDLIVEDYNIRKFLKKTLYGAGVPKIEIERSNDVVTLFVHCARPGMVIGKDGAEVEKVRAAVEAMIGKKVKLNIVEVRSPDMDAQLVAENLAQQLEKRITRAPFPCRPSVPTATTASLRLPPPSAASASRSGSTRARSSPRPCAPLPARWTPPSLTRSAASVVPVVTATVVPVVTARASSAAMARTASTAMAAVPRAIVPRVASASPQRIRKEGLTNASAEESKVSSRAARPYDR